MIFKAKKKKKIVCVCALRLRKPTVSHRRDKHWWLVCVSSFFFFFLPYCQEKLPGEKKREDHFVGSESLSVMAVVIFVTWLPLLFANCKPPFMSTV